jgi:hypothetical protein
VDITGFVAEPGELLNCFEENDVIMSETGEAWSDEPLSHQQALVDKNSSNEATADKLPSDNSSSDNSSGEDDNKVYQASVLNEAGSDTREVLGVVYTCPEPEKPSNAASVKPPNAASASKLSHSDVKDHLEGITKDMRERKATKSDDAAVPMSLWEEHLVEDGTREWTAEEKKGLPRACDFFRKRMLYWWKGRVLSTFHTC